jgi:hypothetical protein
MRAAHVANTNGEEFQSLLFTHRVGLTSLHWPNNTLDIQGLNPDNGLSMRARTDGE